MASYPNFTRAVSAGVGGQGQGGPVLAAVLPLCCFFTLLSPSPFHPSLSLFLTSFPVPGSLDASPSPTVCPPFSLLLCLSRLLCQLVFLSFCVSISLQQNRS